MANDNHKIATRARVTPLASTTIVTLNSTTAAKANSDASDSDEHSQHKEGEASSRPCHGHLSPINSGVLISNTFSARHLRRACQRSASQHLHSR